MHKNEKLLAVLSYLTVIGWIIALIFYSQKKYGFTAFHVRQALLLHILLFLHFVPLLGWIMGFYSLLFLLVGLVQAIQGKKFETPLIGHLAQKWFRGI
jgi:uncharacterized membrane protein